MSLSSPFFSLTVSLVHSHHTSLGKREKKARTSRAPAGENPCTPFPNTSVDFAPGYCNTPTDIFMLEVADSQRDAHFVWLGDVAQPLPLPRSRMLLTTVLLAPE